MGAVNPVSNAVPFTASADPARLDRDWIWRMLSIEAYWHRWRTRDDIERAIDGAWLLYPGGAETSRVQRGVVGRHRSTSAFARRPMTCPALRRVTPGLHDRDDRRRVSR